MKILRARTNIGDYVLSLDQNGIRDADSELNLRGDGAYREYILDNSHPIYKEVVECLNRKKFVVLNSKICSGLFLSAPTE